MERSSEEDPLPSMHSESCAKHSRLGDWIYRGVWVVFEVEMSLKFEYQDCVGSAEIQSNFNFDHRIIQGSEEKDPEIKK